MFWWALQYYHIRDVLEYALHPHQSFLVIFSVVYDEYLNYYMNLCKTKSKREFYVKNNIYFICIWITIIIDKMIVTILHLHLFKVMSNNRKPSFKCRSTWREQRCYWWELLCLYRWGHSHRPSEHQSSPSIPPHHNVLCRSHHSWSWTSTTSPDTEALTWLEKI